MRCVYRSLAAGVVFGSASVFGSFCQPALADGAALPSWTGFYAGVSLGGRWNRADWTTNGFIIPGLPGVNPIFPDIYADFGSARPRLGGYLGYNFQIGRWVVGAEGDSGNTFGTDTSTVGIPGTGRGFGIIAGFNPSETTVQATWDASIRARAGYLIAPDILLYGTGGIAFQHIGETILCSGQIPASAGCGLAGSPDVTSSAGATLTGWTAGGGIEAPIGGHWLLRAEYRYADFGRFEHTFALGPTAIGDPVVSTRIATHLMNLGLAYKFGPETPAPMTDFPRKAPVLLKAPSRAEPSWTGFYAGLGLGGRHTGADWTTNSLTFGAVPFADNQASFDDIAFHYGSYAGFNYQISRVVIGAEGGVGNTGHSTQSIPGVPGLGGAPAPSPDITSVGTNWDANVVGRLGYLAAPDLLLYGVAGVAFQNATFSSICTFVGECLFDHAESFSTTRSGPTVGGGIEVMFAPHLIARLDYRYADFGTVNHTFFVDEPFLSPTTSTTIRTQTFTFGVAYSFMPTAE